MTPTDPGVAPGPVLLQGGAEFGPGCVEMDDAFQASAPDGPVVIVLGAATPGADFDRAAERAARHYGRWPRAVVVAPHPEVDVTGCAGALGDAAVVVMPGGSPQRLLAGLQADGGRVADALLSRRAAGTAVSGASAGAMVLCSRLVLPERGRTVVDGLGVLPGLALPHYGGPAGSWSDPAQPDAARWGLPECGGVLVEGDSVRAVGQGVPQLLLGDRVIDVPRVSTRLADLLAS